MTPGIWSPARTRSYARAINVDTSCVKDDSSFGRGSGEHRLVACATKTDVLHAHQIRLRHTS
jgi:hypothetical protein